MFKFCFILLLPSLLNAQTDQSSLSSRFEKVDSATVLLGLIRCNKLKKYFPDEVVDKFYNVSEHSFTIKYSLLFEEVNSIFDSSHAKGFILTNIDKWLKNDSLLSSLQKNEVVPVEEVLYKNQHTRSLFTKYLENPMQTWESLSTWQSYELYIDFLNYAQSLSPVKIKALFQSLSDTVRSIENMRSKDD